MLDDAQWIGLAGIISTAISGYFALKAARTSGKINKKVGNGFAEEVQSKLDTIVEEVKIAKEQAVEAKRLASTTNDQIRRTRSSVDRLKGQFDQHVTQHNWSK